MAANSKNHPQQGALIVIGLFLSFSIITLCNFRAAFAQEAAATQAVVTTPATPTPAPAPVAAATQAAAPAATASPAPDTVTAPVPQPQKVIMAFGDSLVAGYGLPLEQSFPAKLAAQLADKGYNVKMINAGVSGDTTADGLARLDWMLKMNPQYVILTLGGNDMLRHIDPALTRSNLEKIMQMLHNRHIPVLITGMQAFSNMGYLFGDAYLQMYKDLAKQYDAVYYPFFLEGVATKPDLNQDDGLHPNAKGVDVIVENMLPSVEKLLARAPAAPEAPPAAPAPVAAPPEKQ